MTGILAWLSKQPELASAISAAAGVVIALFALVVSVASLLFSWLALRQQHRHNVLSVRPLPGLLPADYDARLTVPLGNNGSGPMIVQRIEVNDGVDSKPSLIEWMPELPAGLDWTTFIGSIKNRSLLPGSKLVLLELRGDPDDASFAEARESVRRVLAKLEVVIHYTDVYGTEFEPARRALKWFGRKK